MSHFNSAVNKVLVHEGGYIFDAIDPGGETNFGISKRQYPDVDIKKLTKKSAVEIYKKDYWLRWRCDEISDEYIASKYLDLVVNLHPKTAGNILQRALCAAGKRVKWDGVVGSKTLAAVNDVSPVALLSALRSEQACHYRMRIQDSPAMEKYRKGWMKRAYS